MRSISGFILALSGVLSTGDLHAQAQNFKAQTIDDKIEIGYGLAVADVQGDGKPDVLLADKHQIVWYENPTWTKHVIAERLTDLDHVCIAARDIDGDGRCEIAVGAGWNPNDTQNSGAVFYLQAPEDRTQLWKPIRLHAEPTTHRMRWLQTGKQEFALMVAPLHGRGNVKGEGAGVKVLAYQPPSDVSAPWKMQLVSDTMHRTHNFDVLTEEGKESLWLGGAEGLQAYHLTADGMWQVAQRQVAAANGTRGMGEVRQLFWPNRNRVDVAAIEPMHGNEVVVYLGDEAKRVVLDSTLNDGHALATGDLLGIGRPQVVAGWRANQSRMMKVGIKLYVPDAENPEVWQSHLIDDNEMACEDLMLHDLDGDGKLEIIAAGRRTKNVKIYWNQSS